MSKENVLFQVEEDDIETTAPEDEGSMVPEPSGRVHMPETSFWALWEGMGTMLSRGMSSIKSENDEVTLVLNKLTTNYTFFMREKEHLDYFCNNIIPEIVRRHERDKTLAIWSAGFLEGRRSQTAIGRVLAQVLRSADQQIAAGDGGVVETADQCVPYNITMFLYDYLGSRAKDWDTRINGGPVRPWWAGQSRSSRSGRRSRRTSGGI